MAEARVAGVLYVVMGLLLACASGKPHALAIAGIGAAILGYADARSR